jgi:hypothetical protein
VPDSPVCSACVFRPCPGIATRDPCGTTHTDAARSRCQRAVPARKASEEQTDGGASAPDLPRTLVRFIAEHGSAGKILAEHAPTKDGRCPRCPAGASSSGRVKSPCTLFLAALAAEKLGAR